MNNKQKMTQLFREYGYPEEVIPVLLDRIGPVSYDKVKKLILPYCDITASKS